MEQKGQSVSATSSVAWFRLAELIARKEKEKSLSIFRLFAHSFNDPAYALQLEGDILLSFEDTLGASEKYKNAAYLYHKDRRFIAAIAVYEQTLMLDPYNYETIASLLTLYALCQWDPQFNQCCVQFITMIKKQMISLDDYEKVIKLLQDALFSETNPEIRGFLAQKIEEMQKIIPYP